MSLWKRWVDLLSRREGGESLALFRIATGLCAFGMLAGDWELAPVIWLDAESGGYRSLPDPKGLIAALGGLRLEVVRGLMVAGMASAAALAAGLWPRLAALLCLQVLLVMDGINSHAGGSYDLLIANALWLLVLADSGAALSLVRRLRTGAWSSDRLVPAWPRYLGIFQLVLLYFSTGIHKISVHWLPGGSGAALYYILQQPSWHRGDMRWLAWIFPLTQLATWGVWLFEVTSPLLLLALRYRDTRARPGWLRAVLNRVSYHRLFAIAGISMHVGIMALMEVGPFSWISLAFYACLWHPDEWRWASRSFAAFRGRGGSTSVEGRDIAAGSGEHLSSGSTQ